jgi:aminopeptidase N
MSSPRLLFCVASFLISLTALNAEKPFDFATTPGKLPKQVVPEEYAIRIVPDLGKLAFAGSETVKLNVREPVRRLVLNALEVKITSAALDGKAIPPSAIKLELSLSRVNCRSALTALS